MRKIAYLFGLFLLLGCDNSEIVIAPEESPVVHVLTVDYTTNTFLGGYTVPLPSKQTFEMKCNYKSPGDFGSVAWYDGSSNTRLFEGTIIWMGKGERTFPEKIFKPGDYEKSKTATKMPNITPLVHDEYYISDIEIDYSPIWEAVANLRYVNEQVLSSVYIYLYQPSVGVGNPEDWYWLIFLHY